MSVDGGVSEFGQFQIVTVNRGARDGLEVGHVMATYRRGALVNSSGRSSNPFEGMRWFGLGGSGEVKPVPVVPDTPGSGRSSEPAAPATGGAVLSGPLQLPDERNGLIFVFRVFEKMSYAMVMRSTRPLYLGDIIQTP
jgi:hypothetical protein